MTTKAAKLAIFIFSTLKMYWTLGNSEGPVLGPVPNLGPVLILGPWDRSGPDQLQTLLFVHVLFKLTHRGGEREEAVNRRDII